jgi:2-polyprenyl-3-methyl-5-hydroxy-6-metoxy-1,4-benzoquinol methylase
MSSLAVPDLSIRCRSPEIMDQPGLDPTEHAHALRGLGRINVLSRSGAALWPAIARLTRRRRDEPVRVLDVACGGGDIALTLARRAVRSGLPVRVEGCDLSPRAIAFAHEQAVAHGVAVRFFEWDALAGPLPDGYDVVTSTLFLHHLDETEAVALLGRMRAAAGRLVLVDDLVRSRLGHALAWVGCRILSRSKVVHHDGPTSVSAAFTPVEVAALAGQAGMEGARITRHWPQRFLLSWSRA